MTDNQPPASSASSGRPATIAYRVHYRESERGWGQSFFHRDFATREEAQAAYDQCNAKNTAPRAPDYYIQAERIEVVEVAEAPLPDGPQAQDETVGDVPRAWVGPLQILWKLAAEYDKDDECDYKVINRLIEEGAEIVNYQPFEEPPAWLTEAPAESDQSRDAKEPLTALLEEAEEAIAAGAMLHTWPWPKITRLISNLAQVLRESQQ